MTFVDGIMEQLISRYLVTSMSMLIICFKEIDGIHAYNKQPKNVLIQLNGYIEGNPDYNLFFESMFLYEKELFPYTIWIRIEGQWSVPIFALNSIYFQ